MNRLNKAVVVCITKHIGIKNSARVKKIEPWWKKWIDGDMKMLMEEVNMLERKRKENWETEEKEN